MNTTLKLLGPWYLRYVPVRSRWVVLITCIQLCVGYLCVALVAWLLGKNPLALPWQIWPIGGATGVIWNAYATSPALLALTELSAAQVNQISTEIDAWLSAMHYALDPTAAVGNRQIYRSTRGLFASAAYRNLSPVAVELGAGSVRIWGLPAPLLLFQGLLRRKGIISTHQPPSSFFK